MAPTAQLLRHTAAFYQLELHRYPEGIEYLAQRGLHDAALIEELGLGYAHGGNLRPHLQQLGYSLERLLQVGLIRPQGQDAFCRHVIFPCRQQNRIVNLYGRSIGSAFPHLPDSLLTAAQSSSNGGSVPVSPGRLELASEDSSGKRVQSFLGKIREQIANLNARLGVFCNKLAPGIRLALPTED